MALKIGVANRKGGIGKSSTALALTAALKVRGYRVLMVDTDPQRNTTNVYRALTDGVPTLYDIIFAQYNASDCIQHTDYGDIIASDDNLESADTMIKPGPGMYKYLRNAIREIDKDYDYIIFDTQPHAGLLLGNVLMACQFIVTPCTCDAFGIQGMMDFYDTIKEYQEDNEKLQILGLLIIKYKGRQSLTKDIEDNLLPQYAERMHTKIFESRIRESVKCQEAQTLRMSIFDYAPNSTTAIDYNNFVDELIREVS
jgi:chromosome partitioning protein